MNNQAVQANENKEDILYLAFELSHKKWKLGFSDGKQPALRQVEIGAGDLESCGKEIEKAKQRFGMKGSVLVRSCYEAGREGFWPHRALTEMGIENIVVDASSIEVNRRQRRAKTDRMDVQKLNRQLVRYGRGEHDVWRVVRVPSEEAEDRRQLHRGLETLKEEKKQHRVRIQSLLFTQGIDVKVGPQFLKKLEGLQRWNRQPIAAPMKRRLEDEYHRLQLVEAQIRESQKAQRQQLKAAHRRRGDEESRKAAATDQHWPGLELDICHGIVRLENVSEPTRGRRSRGADADAVQQWRQRPGTRHQPSRQRPRAETGD